MQHIHFSQAIRSGFNCVGNKIAWTTTRFCAHVRTCLASILFLSFGIWPFEARAGDLSDLFSKITTVSKDAGNAIKVVFFIAGICFIGGGIMKLIQASDRHEPKGPGLTYIFLGFLLLGVYSLAKAGSQSLLGVEGGVTLNND